MDRVLSLLGRAVCLMPRLAYAGGIWPWLQFRGRWTPTCQRVCWVEQAVGSSESLFASTVCAERLGQLLCEPEAAALACCTCFAPGFLFSWGTLVSVSLEV